MYYSSFSKHYSYLLIAHVLLAMKKKKHRHMIPENNCAVGILAQPCSHFI